MKGLPFLSKMEYKRVRVWIHYHIYNPEMPIGPLINFCLSNSIFHEAQWIPRSLWRFIDKDDWSVNDQCTFTAKWNLELHLLFPVWHINVLALDLDFSNSNSVFIISFVDRNK